MKELANYSHENKPKRFIYPTYHILYKTMITKKGGREEGIYKTLLKTAQIKAKQERRDNRLSFLGEGRGGAAFPLPVFLFLHI